ncbi:hypothetical protein WA026_007472 [Henosepilachna vigintioctopunctata]|uniref:Protein SON n=1 Tax=Henosepilachna vigintioctopunctata TaxID=420089 RepID=A0AAW1UPA2_9CUCU
MENESENETKPILPTKSSMEILSELFSTFHAEPPIIIKQEKVNENKKHKKKKKHKSKDKKHKRKSKRRKRSTSSSSSTSNCSSELDFDLSNLLVKQEEQSNEKKIKIEGTELSLSLDELKDITPVEDNVETILNCTNDSEEHKTKDSEVSDREEIRKFKKHKSKHRHRKDYSRERAQKVKVYVDDNSRCEISIKQHNRDRSIERHRSKDKEGDIFYKSRDKEDYKSDRKRSRSPHKSDLRVKEKHEIKYHREGERYSRYNSFYDRGDDFYKPRERDRSYNRDLKDDFYKPRSRSSERNREERWYSSKRSWDHSKDRKYRDRSTEKQSSHIDKKKLLEIARKNAIQMMKSGSLPGALTLGPQAQEKVIAAIKAGGKTIEELTDFCKTLSKKEDLGELSDIEEDKGSESDNDKPFNHPFQIKDRPTTITMNIKNSVPLPVKSTQERSTELRMQFPVSSGQHHRKNEHEWVTVEPKKDITSATKPLNMTTEKTVLVTPLVAPVHSAPLLSTISLPPSAPPLPVKEPQPAMDISAIVSQRLSAMRKLQENPHDVQALSQMYKSTKEVQSWAESKQQPGQFTGSVGGNFLSHSELSSGYQAWAKKAKYISLMRQGSQNRVVTMDVILCGSITNCCSSFWGYGDAFITKNGLEAR